jgi:hypothetical protein
VFPELSEVAMRRIAVLALVAGLILATAQAPASAGHPDATIVDTARGRGQVAALAVDRIIPELRAQGWRFTLPRRHG